MTLGSCWLMQDDMKARTRGERVSGTGSGPEATPKNQLSANAMVNRDTISDKEVLATLSGFQYQESQRSLSVEFLKSCKSNHLLSRFPQDINNQDPSPRFTWSTTGTSTV